MITGSGLAQLNLEVAAAACEDMKTPLPMTSEDWDMIVNSIDEGNIPEGFRSMPNLGSPDHLEMITGEEWEVVDQCFHDISAAGGLYDAGGPAASIYQLAIWGRQVTEDLGCLYFFIGDAYQFQATTYAVRKV